MDDSVTMRGGQSVRNLDTVFDSLIDGQGPLFEPPGKRLAFQILRHQEVDTILIPDIMQRTDVWMCERREGLGLAVEARTELLVGRESLRQHLNGNRAIEPRVHRTVDLAHAPDAQEGVDAVRAQLSPGFQ